MSISSDSASSATLPGSSATTPGSVSGRPTSVPVTTSVASVPTAWPSWAENIWRLRLPSIGAHCSTICRGSKPSGSPSGRASPKASGPSSPTCLRSASDVAAVTPSETGSMSSNQRGIVASTHSARLRPVARQAGVDDRARGGLVVHVVALGGAHVLAGDVGGEVARAGGGVLGGHEAAELRAHRGLRRGVGEVDAHAPHRLGELGVARGLAEDVLEHGAEVTGGHVGAGARPAQRQPERAVGTEEARRV